MTHFSKNKRHFILIKAFTLVELITVIALITILAGIGIVAINPIQIYSNERNSQRLNDLNLINLALTKYAADTDSNGQLKHLYNLPGYYNLFWNATDSGIGLCNGGSSAITSNINGAYDIGASGANTLIIQSLVDGNYLNKIPKDPSQVNYKVCIDPSSKYKLVLFSPILENSTNYVSTLVDISPSPNVNYEYNPSSESVNWGWGLNNSTYNTTFRNVTTGCFLSGNNNHYFSLTPDNPTQYVQANSGGDISNFFFVPDATYTFSVDVDKGTYAAGVFRLL